MKDIAKIFKPITDFFIKFNLSIFVVSVATGLGVAVYLIANILTTALDSSVSTDNGNNTQSRSLKEFSSSTNKLTTLYTSDSMPDYTTASGRSNPFGE